MAQALRNVVVLTTWLILPVALRAQEAASPPPPVQTEPAQQGDNGQTLRLHVTAKLIVLDVVVTDKHGTPVLDLGKDDFKVYEGKDEQRIRSVEPPSAHALPVGNIVHSSADLGKIGSAPVNIIVLDELNTPFEDNAYTRFSAQKYLKAQPEVMPPTTLLAANNSQFVMLQDYTQDRNVLEAALKRDPAEYPWRLARNGNDSPEAVVRFGQTLDTLQQIAQAAAGTPGRKNIIWIGKGFPSIDTMGMDASASKPVIDAIRRCTDLLMNSRVTLYMVDPTPLSSATYDTVDVPTSLADLQDETGTEPFESSIGFTSLVKTTGGHVFDSRNDVNHEIEESIRDGADYYTIAYTPTAEPDPDDAYRHVHVIVGRPGLTAATRSGYYLPPNSDDSSAADPKAAKAEQNVEVLDVASAALSKMVYNGVKVRAGKGSAGIYNLAIADSSVTWEFADDGSQHAPVSIIAVCFNAKGKVLSHAAVEKTLTSKTPNAKAGLEEIVALPLAVPVGTTRMRFIVRDMSTGHLGSADVDQP